MVRVCGFCGLGRSNKKDVACEPLPNDDLGAQKQLDQSQISTTPTDDPTTSQEPQQQDAPHIAETRQQVALSVCSLNNTLTRLSRAQSTAETAPTGVRPRGHSLVQQSGIQAEGDVLMWSTSQRVSSNPSEENVPLKFEQLRQQHPREFGDCVDAFNQDATVGLRRLAQNGFLEQTPSDIAAFLFEVSGLSRTQIGNFLSRRDKLGVEVRQHFIKKFDFAGLEIDDALRVLLCGFKLSGEAQVLDRMVEHFAFQYVNSNPQKGFSLGNAYVISFAIVMLNTDLHNPHVRHKMTRSQFVDHLLCTLTAPHNITPEEIGRIFDNVLETPIRLSDDHVRMTTFCSPHKQGWVQVMHRTKGLFSNKKYLKRWCVIKHSCIYFFENPQDDFPLVIVPLDHLMHVEALEKPSFLVALTHQSGSFKSNERMPQTGKIVVVENITLALKFNSQREVDAWRLKLHNAVMLRKRAFTRHETRQNRP